MIKLENIKVDSTWSYSDKSVKETSYVTHDYYSYPAKFIPQIASRLILENSNEGDLVIDPFMGSGTTIVESLINKRKTIGCDINYVAYHITKAKTTPVDSDLISKEILKIQFDLEYRMNGMFDFFSAKALSNTPTNLKIDYWFTKNQRNKLAVIYSRILEIKNHPIKNLFLVAFAQILKTCSIWLQSSVKPTRDLDKEEYDPLKLFLKKLYSILQKNQDFINHLDEDILTSINKYRTVKRVDARNIPCRNNNASLIVTSPPYVTSYEYADLHQLPALWFNKLNDLASFRKGFIGSVYKLEEREVDLKSDKAKKIINEIIEKRKEKEVRKYYEEMLECFMEMKRVLKKNGKVCIVIGNTNYKNTDISNHAVFIEQLHSIGFKIKDVILREITSKMLPTYRDPNSGRFSKPETDNVMLVHPKEYIIIAKKK